MYKYKKDISEIWTYKRVYQNSYTKYLYTDEINQGKENKDTDITIRNAMRECNYSCCIH